MFVAGVTLAATLASCGGETPTATTTPAATGAAPTAAAPAASNLSGNVTIDGSSTVAPLSKAVAEDFAKASPGVKVPVGTSGTGGGFKKFCAGDTDISNASRPIKKAEEEECKKNGVEFVEIPVAIDGLTVVVNKENTWAKCLTVAELKTMWSPDAQGKITNWNQIRPDFPDTKLALLGPGADSGTFDYFTEAINGKSKVSRTDFQPSEDDNIIVKGVQGDKGGLGFFGVAYYEENAATLTALEIDGGAGCVAPTSENINTGKYSPLSRPLLIYIKKKAYDRPETKAFVDFYIANQSKLAKEVGYVALPSAADALIAERIKTGKTGSTFHDAKAGTPIIDLLK
ncbi:MAG: phosphate-binding protein [Oscillatoriales cyanobacterium CG2_30_44_21]|nr:MAG: phosphate-binding protein [Oscillatoriales cyanobacterium CG2_30_44_21]